MTDGSPAAAALLVQPRGTASVRFTVRVQPRAARTAVAGVQQGALRVRLQAPPVDGAANAALVDFLAGELGVGRRAVRLVSGHTGRSKTVEVDGVTAPAVRALAAAPENGR